MKIKSIKIKPMKFVGLIGFLLIVSFMQIATAQTFSDYNWETIETTGEPVARQAYLV